MDLPDPHFINFEYEDDNMMYLKIHTSTSIPPPRNGLHTPNVESLWNRISILKFITFIMPFNLDSSKNVL